MRFFLGTHQPGWLGTVPVPLFVSHRRLHGRKRLPRAIAPWALDSGGFSELSLYGEWRTTAQQYVAAVRRYRDEIGHLQWAAPRDMMCEPHMLARTGLSAEQHLRRTVDDFQRLRDLAPDLPIIPVLQGFNVPLYWRCWELYDQAGVDLTAAPLVGLGSVCRRQHVLPIALLVSNLAADGLRLHGFGVKSAGLEAFGHHLASADSMAWSYGGRREAGCSPGHASEANCLDYALSWRDTLLTRLHRQAPERTA